MSGRGGRHDTIDLDGAQVRAARTRQQLTQAALAARVSGVSRGYLAAIEISSRHRVSRAVAEGLAAALDTRVEALQAPPLATAEQGPLDRAATLAEIERRLARLQRDLDEVVGLVERLRRANQAPER